ncbi:Type 1 glutamine amidotransferase-like domain-containing protein [Quadrisphaera setariae]|uniref:Dipeptidase E n=1 Tax=Quadrisphaera setariae TaxID=2593304 RepID=A0A5C8ZK58_9ACTN|nr:Type 1 glutamine amidotransferase-like domain-containing protein [Quadrisphaera setariae]TXR57296.1 hypothetical protein FMM08_03195 [Quadrisphaera setariae]
MTVFLGGGGTAQQEAALWAPMLARRPRVLYWPFALGDDMLSGAETWLRGSLAEFQHGLDVTTWLTLDGRGPADLEGFDLVFIGGGNTYDLLAHLRTHGALGWVRTHLAGGGDLYGGSAGAILAGATVGVAAWHDENATDLTTPGELAGLGLLPGRALLPHFAADDAPRAQEWAERLGLEVLGVPEASGLVVEGDDVVVAGPEPVWRCTPDGATALPPGSSIPRGGATSGLVPPSSGPGRPDGVRGLGGP